MSFLNVFYADVKRISIAHERTVDSTHKCEFPNGRGQYGLVYCIQGEGEYRFSTGRMQVHSFRSRNRESRP